MCRVKQAIYEQKYLELLEKRDMTKALDWLRNELITATKEWANFEEEEHSQENAKEKIKVFSSLIMCKNVDEIKNLTGWDGSQGESRNKLLEFLNINQSGRLESLLKQSLYYQVWMCRFHDWEKKDYNYSLLEAHKCEKTPLPNKLLQSIQNHTDEVWYLALSPDGKRLASVGKDKVINIWDLVVGTNSLKITLKKWIKLSHSNLSADINSIMWNKNSDLILTCAENAKIFDIHTGECLRSFKGNTDKISCALWADNDTKIIAAEVEKCMKMWSKDGTLLHTWNTNCYIDVVNNRENGLIAYYTGSKINIIDLETKEVVKSLEEEEKVRSITMSHDGKYLLANCSDIHPVINLWHIEQAKIIQRYMGHKQSKYVLKWAFGGKFENYIVCGSEDDLIYIWNRSSGELLETLEGHTNTVNNIAWSPQLPNFLFSCSDDQTIKVWGANQNTEVKVHIDPKFKNVKDEDNISANNSDNQINNMDDSESIGESSLNEGSIFSDDEGENN